jgi:hypothetical protein
LASKSEHACKRAFAVAQNCRMLASTTGRSSAPADFGKLIAEETEKCAEIVKFAGIKAE